MEREFEYIRKEHRKVNENGNSKKVSNSQYKTLEEQKTINEGEDAKDSENIRKLDELIKKLEIFII
jgi:flagellar motility protein MotE (MotC chaperone)